MIGAMAGRAWRTPLGASIERVVSRMLAGEHAVQSGPHADLAGCRLRCAVPDRPAPGRNERFLDRLGLLALEAGREALAGAGLAPGDPRLERTALFAATGGLRPRWDDLVGALARQREGGDRAWDRGLAQLHPFWMLQHLSNNVHALLSIDLQIRGDGATFAGATASAEALCAAVRALEAGTVDAALVVAHDSLLDAQSVADMTERRVATRAGLRDWRPPYDEAAEGVVPGECAAAMVLVRAPAGKGLPLLSCAAAIDGEPLPSGEPRAERLAQVAALVSRGDEVVDGAAWAQPDLDLAEREHLARVVPGTARLLASAASLGRLGAAGSLVQAIAGVEILRRRVLPPIAGLQKVATGPLQPVLVATPVEQRSALLLSAGSPGLVAAVRVEVP
jgi:3-oxoacyl-[acyl-carrier-protein] synthase I